MLVLALGLVALGLRWTEPARIRGGATDQIRQLVEAGHAELALRHLGQYLASHPDDVPLLLLQARLTAEQAADIDGLDRAARLNQRLLWLEDHRVTEGDRDAIRRRLAALFIRLSDAYRTRFAFVGDPEQAAFESRYRPAADIARRLIERHGDDPEAHRLLGQALEGLAGSGSGDELKGAIASYRRALVLLEEALARDPDDEQAARGAAVVASRLARLLRDRQDDPQGAEAVLDRLVAARPGAVEPRLIRYRYDREAHDEPRADAELHAALERAPDDPTVRLAAAEHALHRGDPAAARDHLEALADEPGENDLRVRLLRGLVEFAEQDESGAMEQWREGLVLVRGADAELSWWLAYVLIRLGRIGEADPLIEQYGRLIVVGADDPALRLLLALRDERRGYPLEAIKRLEDLRGAGGIDGWLRDEVILALGRCHEALGDREQAARIYRLAAQIDSHAVAPVMAEARLLRAEGRLDEAVRLLEQALAERAVGAPELLLALAEIHLSRQAARPPPRRSWEAFDAALAALPETVEPINQALLRADRAVLDGRDAQADDLLERAIADNPGAEALWSARAEVLTRDGRPEEALKLLRLGLQAEQPGDNVPMRLMTARVLVALGRGREAQGRLIADLDGLQAVERADLWEALGRLRMAQGDPTGAASAFRAWADLEPFSPEPALARIDAALAAGPIGEVAALLEDLGKNAGTETSSDLPFRMARAATLLELAGRRGYPEASTLKAADDQVVAVLADARELPRAHLLLGRVRRRRGRLDEAAAAFRLAWRGGARGALPPLVEALAELGRFDELERLADTGAGSALERLSAQVLLGAGQVERASRLLDRAVADPADPAVAETWRRRMLELSGRRDELESLRRRRAESASPDDPEPWLDLVAAQARSGRDREALEVTIQRAIDRTPGVPVGALEARLRLAAGDPRGADAGLKAALARRPDDPALLTAAVSFYQQTGRPDRAEPLLERLIALDNAGDAPALQLAMLLSGRAAGDRITWRRALELVGPADGDPDPDRRLARAVVIARTLEPERRVEAVGLFETLIADLPVTHPRAVEARDQLARLLIELGRADRATAVTAVSAGQAGAPASAVALHARALLRAGRATDASRQLDHLDLLRPGDPEAAALRATLLIDDGPKALERAAVDRLGAPGGSTFARAACLRLLNEGAPEAVAAAIRIASDLADEDPGRAWVLGLVLAVRGHPDEALDRCAEALRTVDLADSTDRDGLIDAVLQAVQASPLDARRAAVERARPMIEALLARRPGDPDLRIALAILDHQVSDYESEAEGYRRVLQRRPGDPMALYNLALVLSEGLGRPEEALEIIDRLAARLGPNAGVLGARGVILTRLGRLDEAISDLGRSVTLAPTADRHYYLARAYHKAGRDDQFRRHLEQAHAAGLDPDSIDAWQRDELRRLLAL